MKTIEEVAFGRYISDQSLSAHKRMDVTCYIDWAQLGSREAQRWITVEEELPEKNINVLLKRSHPFHLYEVCGFVRDNVFYSNEIARPFTNVTHWRPLERK